MKIHSFFSLVRGNLLEGKMHLHCPYTAHNRSDLVHSDSHSSKQQDEARRWNYYPLLCNNPCQHYVGFK